MAGPVELHGIEPRRLGKPVEREVPGQCVRPFVAEHLDGLRIAFITESAPIRNFGKDCAIAPISGGVTIRELKWSILSPTPALDSEAWRP